jgi:hypothetical protein
MTLSFMVDLHCSGQVDEKQVSEADLSHFLAYAGEHHRNPETAEADL